MAHTSDQHIIDISEPWELCIYKVPQPLRKENPNAYTPQLISIGPIHHGKEELKPMEEKKKSYSDSFWKERVENGQAQNEYRSYLENNEQNIRKCYSEEVTSDLNGKTFREIILLDSVFIMELLLLFKEIRTGKKDFILSNAWLSSFIQTDMLLLENQLPIRVLEKLYTYLPVSVPDDGKGEKKNQSFVDIAKIFFENYNPQRPSLKTKPSDFNQTQHFTDLVRNFYIVSTLDKDAEKQPGALETSKKLKKAGVTLEPSVPDQALKTATKLKKAGITFESPVPERFLLDIQFQKGLLSKFMLCFSCIPYLNSVKARLLLPTFRIDDATEWILRNLIAFEQCHCLEKGYICHYIALFDYLINSREDVDLLVESKVIAHELGSDKEVAILINRLCKNVVFVNNCYDKMIQELNDHYKSSWNVAMAELRSVYYRDLWRGSSTIVGLAVLFFTFYNFFRSVI